MNFDVPWMLGVRFFHPDDPDDMGFCPLDHDWDRPSLTDRGYLLEELLTMNTFHPFEPPLPVIVVCALKKATALDSAVRDRHRRRLTLRALGLAIAVHRRVEKGVKLTEAFGQIVGQEVSSGDDRPVRTAWDKYGGDTALLTTLSKRLTDDHVRALIHAKGKEIKARPKRKPTAPDVSLWRALAVRVYRDEHLCRFSEAQDAVAKATNLTIHTVKADWKKYGFYARSRHLRWVRSDVKYVGAGPNS